MDARRSVLTVPGICALCGLALGLGVVVRSVLPGLGIPTVCADNGTPASPSAGDEAAVGAGAPVETTAVRKPPVEAVAQSFTVKGAVRGKVLIGKREVLRTLYPHNDVPALERATRAASRINLALSQGARPDDFRAVQQGKEWLVVTRDQVVISVAPREPEAYKLSAQKLAERWASNISLALHEAFGTKPGEAGLPPFSAEAKKVMMGQQEVGALLVNGKEILRFTRGAVGLSPVERAAIVAERLRTAVGQGALPQDIRATTVYDMWVVQVSETLLVTVNDEDATEASTTPQALAQAWASALADAVRSYYASAGAPIAPPVEEWKPQEPYDEKWVPIVSVLEGLKVGLARVNGPTSRVRQVQAVAQLETHWKDYLEIDIYLPISTKVPGKTLDRIEGCGVTGLADIDL